MTQPLQLGERPRATRGKVRLLALRHAPRRSDERGHARLPGLSPPLIPPVAIAAQDPRPVVDESCEGFFGAAWMDPVERHSLTDHHPEPGQRMRAPPCGFINRADEGMPCLRGNGAVVRLDSLSHAVEDFLEGSQADGHLQDRRAQGLHHPSAVPIGPGQLPHEGTEARTIPARRLGRHLRLRPVPPVRPPALRQDNVCHLHRDGRELDHLVGREGLGQCKSGMATRPPHGLSLVDGRRRQELLAMAWMAWFPARFAGRDGGRAHARLLVWRVRRARSQGSNPWSTQVIALGVSLPEHFPLDLIAYLR